MILTIADKIALTAMVVSALSTCIAAAAIFVSQRESRKSRDVQTALQLFETFRANWIGGWKDAFNRKEASPDIFLPEELETQFYRMLNWVDGIGRLVQKKGITDPRLVFGTFEYQIRQLIQVARPIIDKGTDAHGEDYWGGLVALARFYKIELNATMRHKSTPHTTKRDQ